MEGLKFSVQKVETGGIKAALLNHESGNDVDSGLRLETRGGDPGCKPHERPELENFQTVPTNRKQQKTQKDSTSFQWATEHR